MTDRCTKVLALALDPAAKEGERHTASIKFVELCQQEGYQARDFVVGNQARRMLELLREASHWRRRAEAAESEVGRLVMRNKHLRAKQRLLAKALSDQPV